MTSTAELLDVYNNLLADRRQHPLSGENTCGNLTTKNSYFS